MLYMFDVISLKHLYNIYHACMCGQTRGPEEAEIPLKHQLLQVIVRVLQYRMLLTGNTLTHMYIEYSHIEARVNF